MVLNPLPWFMQSGAHRIYSRHKFPILILDFETTNLEFGTPTNYDNHLILACWRVVQPDGSYEDFSHFGDEWDQNELIEAIAGAAFVVAHNAKFELGWLKRCGVNLRKVLPFCTMLGQWVLDGNRREPRGLQDLAVKYNLGAKGDVVSAFIKAGTCPSEIPKRWLLDYCKQDVDLTHRLFLVELQKLEESNLTHIVHTRNINCAVLADIEFNGVTLDPERVNQEYDSTLREYNETSRLLAELASGVNFNSPKQLGQYLFETLQFSTPRDQRGNPIVTSGGSPKTDAATLGLLKASTSEQSQFLELYKKYNKLDSLLSKNLVYFKKTCEQKGGTFLGTFNQGITATHRLSSSGRPVTFDGEKKAKSVQFQNMPRQYKKLFAEPGDYLIGECDAAQLEFRVAADLGNDPTAHEEITSGADVHGNTATVLYENGDEEMQGISDPKERRQQAKKSTFAPLFGGMGKSTAQKAYAEYFKEHYAGVSATQREWTLKVASDKVLTTPYGLCYYWPNAKMQRSGYITHTTEIMNYPIQGLATGEIIPIAATCFWHRSEGRDITLLNTIHDSLIAKVHKDEVEAFELLAKQCLTKDVFSVLEDNYNYHFKVPLGVEIKCSKHWGETNASVTYNVYPDGTEERTVKGD